MPYQAKEINELEVLIEEVTQKVREELIVANRIGNMEEVLDKYGFSEKRESNFYYDTYNSKIIVIGSIEANKKEIEGCIKKVGIDKKKVELYTDYEKLTNTNFSFLKNNMNYSDILVCAMPHKMKGIGNYASLVSMIENNKNDFPNLIKIGDMKYSNSAFKKALLETNYYKDMISNY